MAHVHYKFSSKLKYDTMVFDGLHITLRDLKRQIMDREKLRAGDCDLQITNAQTKEEYKDDEDLISKNSSVIVRRIPMVGVKSSGGKTSKTIDRSDHSFHPHAFGVSKAMENQSVSRSLAFLSQTCNLAHADVSEADKIQAMMSQSNHEYDPMNYVKKHGIPPPNYTCFRCGMTGHHIRNCPTAGDKSFESLPKIKKSTGIPRSFMVEVDDPSIKGAMLTNCGRYAIPTIDAEAYAKGKKERPPFVSQQRQARVSGGNEEEREEGEAVPTELLCPICRETLHDAVLIPCCGNSYCDDCIRSALLESDEHVCPTCNKADVSPDTLVANKFLRQAVNSFKNEVGHKKSQTTKGSGTPVSQPPNPSPCPNPTPPASTQTRPQRPYPPIRHQQDPLLSHPPASHTPPLVQPSAMSPVATGASSAYSTPVGSPQRPQNHPDTPGSKEAEAEISIDAADPPIPSVSPSPEEEGPAAPPVMPPGYHVPVAEDLESTSPKNAQMSPTYPIVGHSEQPPVQESSSTSSDLAGGGAWSYPMKDPCPSLPPSHPSSDSSPVLATPAASLLPLPLPPPPHQHFHPPPPLFPPKSFPPYPGFPPGYPFSAPPWAPPSLPAVFPNVPPPTLPSSTSSIPPLIPKEEMYRHKTRMKERASSSHGANRDRQSQQRHKSNLDEMGSDFTKELLEYRRLQKQRRRSYSRSPQRSSSISQMSSDSYSKSYSHSSHSRSYSRSPSRSRSRSRGRSRSRSRSRSRPRHRQRSARHKANRAHDHGYKRSHSPTPPSSSPSRRRRSSRSRSWSRSRSRGSRQKTGGGHRHRARSCRCRHGPPGEQSSPERYRQWEREYMEWYDKYFGNYTGKPHHLQPPPLLPTPRHARGPPASGSARRPYSSSSYSSKCGESQPSRAATRRSRNPTPRQSPNRSPFPGSEDEAGSLTYQQRCSVMYGRQGSEWEKPEAPGLGTDHRKATLEHSDALPIAYRTSSTDLNDQNHKRKKRRRSERDRAEMGEAEEESLSLAASYASNRGHREGRSKRGSPRAPVVRSESDDPGDDACDNPRVGTQRGDGCPSAEPSRASEVGGPKDADRRLAHGSKDLDTSRSEKKKRREKEKNSKSPRTDEHHLDAHKSESSKSGRDGEDPRHGTKKRKPKTGEKEPGIRGSPTESCLWEGVTTVKKPQRKTISISINLRGQSDEAQKGGESDRMAGSWVEVDKMDTGGEKEEAAAEKGVEENAAEDGAIKKQTTTPRATEEMTWGGEEMETKRIRRDDGGEVMEEEEKEAWMAGAKKRQSGEEPVEQMAERSKTPGRRSKSNSAAGETAVHPSHRRDGREGRQERKVALKSLEKYSGPGGFLLPEDKKVLMQVPRSKWEQLGEEDEECGVEEEPASMKAQSASAAAAVGAVSVAVPTTRAAAREGGTPEDGAREQRWWEAEGERERGRTSETAKKKYREAAARDRAPASPVSKEPSEAPERHASPADAERAHKPGRAGRGTQRTGDGEGSKDQRAQRAMGTDRKREELEGRSKEREGASGGTAGAATDGQKRGPSSSRASSSSGSAGNKRARDPEYERGAARNSQSSSSRSSSSSSCSFSQPDVHPQRAPAGSVSGGKYREYGTPPRHDRSAYETHQEKPLAKPQDRQDDAESLKYHHHPQNRRPHNQDHRRHRDHDHPHVREHRDHHGDRPPAAPQPGGRPPALLASSGERREPRPLIPHSEQPGHGAGPPAAGRPTPGKAVAPADRGRSKPGSDVFSRGREPLLRPRKPIDIKIISGASLFQHVDLEKNNRL